MIHSWLNSWCGTRGYEGQAKWTSVYISVTIREYYTVIYFEKTIFNNPLYPVLNNYVDVNYLWFKKKKINEYNLINLKYRESTVPVDMMLYKP